MRLVLVIRPHVESRPRNNWFTTHCRCHTMSSVSPRSHITYIYATPCVLFVVYYVCRCTYWGSLTWSVSLFWIQFKARRFLSQGAMLHRTSKHEGACAPTRCGPLKEATYCFRSSTTVTPSMYSINRRNIIGYLWWRSWWNQYETPSESILGHERPPKVHRQRNGDLGDVSRTKLWKTVMVIASIPFGPLYRKAFFTRLEVVRWLPLWMSYIYCTLIFYLQTLIRHCLALYHGITLGDFTRKLS